MTTNENAGVLAQQKINDLKGRLFMLKEHL